MRPKCFKMSFLTVLAVLVVSFVRIYKMILTNSKLDALNDFEVFTKDWCRVRQARTDIQSVLGPCRNRLKWTYDRTGVRTNASASFISGWKLKPAGQFSRFFIQAVSDGGTLKTTGGDWWRVQIRNPVASFRPAVFDLENGTYEVVFLIVEAGIYRVDITLDYTLCHGFRDPPENWFILGKLCCTLKQKSISQMKKKYILKVTVYSPLCKQTFCLHF